MLSLISSSPLYILLHNLRRVTTTTTMTSALPIISLTSSTLPQDILQGLCPSGPQDGPTGFFYLVDHQVPPEESRGAFEASRCFFEEETEEEKRKTIDRSGHTGWTGVGEES
jgi:isopenicillin N synthase-like dioxygenase